MKKKTVKKAVKKPKLIKVSIRKRKVAAPKEEVIEVSSLSAADLLDEE